jgi:hypothetical protein
MTLHWEVILTTGRTVTGQTTLTGTTAVSLDTSLTGTSGIVQVSDLYVSQALNGTLTIHEDSGAGTELGRINIGNLREYRWVVALAPTPSGVNSYIVEAERQMTDLVQPSDEPVLPPRFHGLLLHGLRRKEYEFKDDQTRYLQADKDYQHLLGLLRASLVGSGSMVPGSRVSERSRLGAWFPADTWS